MTKKQKPQKSKLSAAEENGLPDTSGIDTTGMTREEKRALKPDFGLEYRRHGKIFTGKPNSDKLSKVKVIYFDPNGRQVCSAYKHTGREICTTPFIQSNGRCNRHGGASLTGMAHHKFKTGRHSKHIPARIYERYEEALSDPELLSFDDEIALIDARISDLLHQTDDGGGGEIYKNALDAYYSFNNASHDGDKQAMREALRRLEAELKKGKNESLIWNEIRLLQEQRRKSVLAQAKHLQLTNQTVTVSRVNLLISALLASVRDEVTDMRVLSRINERFQKILAGEGTAKMKQLNSKR